MCECESPVSDAHRLETEALSSRGGEYKRRFWKLGLVRRLCGNTGYRLDGA